MSSLFWNNLRRILRSRVNIIFMIILPVVLILFIMSTGIGKGNLVCGVVDLDDTEFTRDFIRSAQSQSIVKKISEGEINAKLVNQTIDCAVVIQKGFTEKLIRGEATRIKSYSLQETNQTAPLMTNINSYLNSARNIAVSSGGSSEKFYQGLAVYNNGSFGVDYETVKNKEILFEKTSIALGFLVMSMLFLSSFAPMIMIRDKENRTFFRIISAPITMRKYMLTNIASFFAVSIIQILLIFFFLTQVVRAELGSTVFEMIILSLIFSLVCVSMGVAINTISRDARQSGLISSLVLSPLCMLGGCWWPIDFMPDILQKIANFVPTTWIMRSYDKVLHGAGIGGTMNEILVMLAFAAVFFLLGSWRKTEVAN